MSLIGTNLLASLHPMKVLAPPGQNPSSAPSVRYPGPSIPPLRKRRLRNRLLEFEVANTDPTANCSGVGEPGTDADIVCRTAHSPIGGLNDG